MTKTNLILIFILSIFCFTCQQDDQPTYNSSLGSLYVTVKQNGSLISNAVVTTNPETTFLQTDFSGSVIVEDIEPGTYQIISYHPDHGTGTGAAIVNTGEVTGVEIQLIPGVFENPLIEFIFPLNGTEIDVDQEAQFSVTVSDNNDLPQNINLEWSSNIDGVLSTEPAGSNGIATIAVNNLTEEDHIIQVKAEDSDGFIGGAVVSISVKDLPNSVFLNQPEGNATNIVLNWTMSDEPDFSNYTIYRSDNTDDNFQVIEIVNDINTLSYNDNNVIIGETYFYQIGLNLNNGAERLSNIQFIPFEGVSIYVGTQVEKMIVDPDRPYIYALDRVNNSLLFINTDDKLVSKTIFVGSSPTDLDMTFDGQKLYIANFGSTQISVVDLETQENDFNFFVDPDVGTWDGNPYRIALLSNNRLAFTSEDQWNNIKIVNATTGANITSGASIYQPNLFTNPSGDVLYAAESGSSGSQVIRYNVSTNSIIEVDASNSVSANRASFITHNGQYIFFRKQKILASSLQSSLGTFSDNIYAANSDGSIALGEEQYFDGETFAILGNLPITSTVMASDPEDDIFYIYNVVSSSIVIFTP